jgi:hypothetical protein
MLRLCALAVIGACPPRAQGFLRIHNPHSDPMAGSAAPCRMLPMTFPTVTEVPPVLAPVTPATFVFAIVRDGDLRSAATPQPSTRRIVD